MNAHAPIAEGLATAPSRDFIRSPSGLFLPSAAAEAQIRSSRRPKAMDFFAGCGGITLGFIQAGFEVVAAVENDPYAVTTFMLNLCRWGQVEIHYVEPADKDRLNRSMERSKTKGGRSLADTVRQGSGLAGSGWIKNEPTSTPGVSHIFFGDVRKLTAERILSDIGMKRGELDCVAGGPPCQGYSTAGKRDVMDPRSSLVFDFARFIVGLNPKTMVMENVIGITTMLTPDGQPVLDQFCRILEDGGFGGFDAFQRALKARPDLAGLMRGKANEKRSAKPRAQRPIPAEAAMPDLFAAE
ncbi:DNA cytosine methyltransferase [Methylobacterium sp. HMF5984]|uniref:DNA cytosine methyltransferase n=1 Tax=Methylobacterium sp. HMF5984 TaxID=3367370 RepID=UPI0038530187